MKKRNFILVLVLLMLFGGIFVIQDTLAKYYSKANKDQTIQVAKWDFDNENLSKNLTVDLQPTVDASSLVNNKVAPGTKGSFSIKLTNANTETAVDFKLLLGSITSKPDNLKFYSDAAHTTELTATGVTGTLKAKDATGLDVKVYWEWKYESGSDDKDTAAGKQALTMKVPVTIEGTQAKPSSTPVVSKIN